MKLMRSRFRLITLLLTCAFLLGAVVCAAAALKQAGVTLPSVGQVLPASESPSPSVSPSEEATPESTPEGKLPEEFTIQPDSEYNIFGL